MLMNLRKRMKNQKGFTLVELMVVIAILGILAALVLPKLSGSNDVAKNGRLVADLRTVDSALNMYFSQNHTYVGTTIAGLKTAGYLNSEPKDAKDTALSLTAQTEKTYVLEGTKANGTTKIKSPGSEGYNADTDK